MIRTVSLLALLAVLGACGDGQPLYNEPDEEPGEGPLPPGTEEPSDRRGINRYEEEDGKGGGYVQDVSYDATNDTFLVDNLAFDGANVYTRDDQVPTLSDADSRGTAYRVFEGAETVVDEFDGDVVEQFQYRAIYGESQNRTAEGEPLTSFAIVRTGSYEDYGFGGFVYERNGSVDLPSTGQAVYAGDYAGIRTFEGRTDLEYTTGEVTIAVDFRDFNEGEGVQGRITNREAFDSAGNLIASGTDGALPMPNLTFAVGPGTLTDAGEMSNGITSFTQNADNSLEAYESGTYYAIVAGENASEIVGVIVIESEDPRYNDDENGDANVIAQETGGFIVYR